MKPLILSRQRSSEVVLHNILTNCIGTAYICTCVHIRRDTPTSFLKITSMSTNRKWTTKPAAARVELLVGFPIPILDLQRMAMSDFLISLPRYARMTPLIWTIGGNPINTIVSYCYTG